MTCEVCNKRFKKAEAVVINDVTMCAECGDNHEACADCGAVFKRGDTQHETTNGLVCSDCFSEYKRCSDCGEYHPENDLRRVGGRRSREFVCESCYNDDYFTCERCNQVHPNEDQTTVRTAIRYGSITEQSWCESCADDYGRECDCCHEIFAENLIDVRGIGLCGNCRDNYYSCNDCGDWVHSDHCYTEDGDEYCQSCYESNHNVRTIHDYNYKPAAIFHGVEDAHQLYLGVELEMECREKNTTSRRLYDLSNKEKLFYLKHDGSISCGFEAVSHPSTLKFHQEELGWKRVLSAAIEEGATSHKTTTCGLHVHLSRAHFRNLSEVTRFVAFVNVHQEPLKVLARRGNTQYTKFKDKSNGVSRMVYQSDRYEAVNLYNEHTIEVRIFRGTLKYDTFLACLEVCDAIARFVPYTNIANIIHKSDENWNAFLSFIKNKKEYSHLNAFFKEKGLDEPRYIAPPKKKVKVINYAHIDHDGNYITEYAEAV